MVFDRAEIPLQIRILSDMEVASGDGITAFVRNQKRETDRRQVISQKEESFGGSHFEIEIFPQIGVEYVLFTFVVLGDQIESGPAVVVTGDQPAVASLAGHIEVEVLNPGDTCRRILHLEESRVVAVGELNRVDEVLFVADDELVERGPLVCIGIARDDPPRIFKLGRVDIL